MLTFTQERETSSCLTAFKLAHQVFPPLTNWNIGSSWALLLLSFGLDLYHQLSWVFSCWLTWHILGFVSSIIMWPIPYNKSINLSISLSGEPWLIQCVSNKSSIIGKDDLYHSISQQIFSKHYTHFQATFQVLRKYVKIICSPYPWWIPDLLQVA